MPSMDEIFRRHADRYDELVDAEDHEGNLRRELQRICSWRGRRVLEAGTGTGRVTDLYIREAAAALCLDGSAHMLERARLRLQAFADRITFQVADNLALPPVSEPYDVFVEGWAFGYTAVHSQQPLAETTRELLSGVERCLVPGAPMILIETLGTDREEVGAPHPTLTEFYEAQEKSFGFQRTVLRTDYRFPDVEQQCGPWVSSSGRPWPRPWLRRETLRSGSSPGCGPARGPASPG